MGITSCTRSAVSGVSFYPDPRQGPNAEGLKASQPPSSSAMVPSRPPRTRWWCFSVLSWRPWASWSTAFRPDGRVAGRRVVFRARLPGGAVGAEVVVRSGVFLALDGDGGGDDGDGGDGCVFEHFGSFADESLLTRRAGPLEPEEARPPAASDRARGTCTRARMPARQRPHSIGAFFAPSDGRLVGCAKPRDVSWLVNRIDRTEGSQPTLRQLAAVAVAKGALPGRLRRRGGHGIRDRDRDSASIGDLVELHVTMSDLAELHFEDPDEALRV